MVPATWGHTGRASQPARATEEDATLMDVKVSPNRGGMMARSSRKGRAVVAVVVGLAGAGGTFALFAAAAPSAFAASSPYELYCPKTPVGNIVLNNVVTSGTITPAAPAAGSQFNLTGYSSVVALPTSIVSAAAALGNSAIAGTAVTKVDATGATPASISSGNLAINAPIPSPVPATGLTLNLPATPASVGPFTATGGAINLTVDPDISLALNVSGSTLTLTCTPYPNNTAATGIVSATPAGSPASPVISTASAGTSTPAPTTAATTPAATTPATTPAATTPAPATSSLASTGPGPDLWLVAVIGFIVLYLGSVVLALVERPRSLLRRVLRMAPPAVPVAAAVAAEPVVAASPEPDRSVWSVPPSAKPAYPKAGSPGLWFDGWEPQGRNRG